MKCFNCLMLFLCLQVCAIAQGNKELNIGDMMPDWHLAKMMNHPEVASSIGSFKGKLLILDFMATSCGGCIKALPRLEALQQQFKDQVQILLVTVERPERVNAFLKRNTAFKLPFVAEDTALAKFFPHQFLSHFAWIDNLGMVRAITTSEYVTEQNIQRVLSGGPVHWPVKKDFTSFDFNQTILTANENNIPQEYLPLNRLYTAVTNGLPGVQKHIGMQKDSAAGTNRYSYINYSIYQLYLVLNGCYNLPKSHILIEAKDRERFIYDPTLGTLEEWKAKNNYCLEAVLPSGMDSAAVKQRLVSDLDFYFGCRGRMEKRLTDCLVLQHKGTVIPVKNAIGGMRVSMLEYLLNDSIGAMPVINETSGTTYTSLPLTAGQIKDDAYRRKVLDQFGLELVKGQRWINCLILTRPAPAKGLIF